MKDNIIERRNYEYSQLIEDFKSEIKTLNIQGVTGPHFPGVGDSYTNAKYKFAFCGIETYGWYSMSSFLDTKPENYLTEIDNCLNNLGFLKWMDNYHATFGGFVLKFLSQFYKIEMSKLIVPNDNTDILGVLKSFVWSNAYSIERHEVFNIGQGSNKKAWEQIKKASMKFDDLNHIINSCNPKVIFILTGGTDANNIVNDATISKIYNIDTNNKGNILKIAHTGEVEYDYFYLRNTDTHLFKLPHPKWMGLYSGIGMDKYVEFLICDLSNYKIWDNLPSSIQDTFDRNGKKINTRSAK